MEATKCKYPFHTATRQSTLFCVQINSSQYFINGFFSPSVFIMKLHCGICTCKIPDTMYASTCNNKTPRNLFCVFRKQRNLLHIQYVLHSLLFYFKQNAIYFRILSFFVPIIFTLFIHQVLNLKHQQCQIKFK